MWKKNIYIIFLFVTCLLSETNSTFSMDNWDGFGKINKDTVNKINSFSNWQAWNKKTSQFNDSERFGSALAREKNGGEKLIFCN